MDPDGTIYYCINLIISFILCLYIAVKQKQEEDQDFSIGISKNLVSCLLLLVINFGVLCSLVLPAFLLKFQLLLGALFVCIGVFIPYCLGLALFEKLDFILKLCLPFITVLNFTFTPILLLPVYGLFKLFRLDTDTKVTQQDVMDLVEDADNNVIDDDQKEMIENIFLLDDMTAGDIMTHRTEVFAVSGEEKCSDVIERAKGEGFSRIPVYSHTIDTILGILYAKDLLNVVGDEAKLERPIKDFVRKAMFVPEACGANELLVQFKLKRTQIAVVVDEYGGTSGVVTMEDVLEEIVGNIQDEYDNEEEMFVQNEDGSYLCLASMDLEDLLDLFDITIPENFKEEDFDTVGGLIIDRLARIPLQEENAKVEYLDLLFTVTEVADRRIVRVKVEKTLPKD